MKKTVARIAAALALTFAALMAVGVVSEVRKQQQLPQE